MKTPNEYDLQQLSHMYDATYAREYYLRTRKLKGRKKGNQTERSTTSGKGLPKWREPGTGKTAIQVTKRSARLKQRKALAGQIQQMEKKLGKLEDLIKKKMREEASEDRKGKAKKERASKESEKPKSAAEKAEAVRENKKYRDKNQQKLKDKRKGKPADSASKVDKELGKAAISDLKTLATKVRGQIAVAKQKLAAL